MDLQQISEVAASLWPLWLMIVFLSIVGWAYWPSHKKRFEDYGDIPFRDDDKE